MSLMVTIYGILLVDGPEGCERGFLRLREPGHAADVHALVGAVAAQRREALPGLPLPQHDDSLIRRTGQQTLICT